MGDSVIHDTNTQHRQRLFPNALHFPVEVKPEFVEILVWGTKNQRDYAGGNAVRTGSQKLPGEAREEQ